MRNLLDLIASAISSSTGEVNASLQREIAAMVPFGKHHDLMQTRPAQEPVLVSLDEVVSKLIAEIDDEGRSLIEYENVALRVENALISKNAHRRASVCRTPGSQFHITIEPDEIGGVVELPPEVTLDGMDQDEAEEAEDMIHDALEDVVAKLVAEFDEDADAHWAQASKNDPVKEELTLLELKRPNLGSAWVVIEDPDTGMLLLGKRAKAANNAGQWNLFGGGIEGTETAIETALRELWEEGGIRATADQVTQIPGTPKGLTIFVLPMTDRQVRGKLKLNPKEVSKVRWCAPDELPENLHKSALGLMHAFRVANDTETAAEQPPISVSRSMRASMDMVEGKKALPTRSR